MDNNFRQRLFHVLHKPSRQNPWAKYVNYLLAALIVANALFVSVGGQARPKDVASGPTC